MLEFFIFIIAFFIVFGIISGIVYKIKGREMGCFSTVLTLLLTVIISMSIAIKLNPFPDQSFFISKKEKKAINKTDVSIENKNKTHKNISPVKDGSSKRIESNNFSSPDSRNTKNYKPNPNFRTNYKSEQKINTNSVRKGALCRDGTFSKATGRGACSHHGGVKEWLY
jgi:hypothetical protein